MWVVCICLMLWLSGWQKSVVFVLPDGAQLPGSVMGKETVLAVKEKVGLLMVNRGSRVHCALFLMHSINILHTFDCARIAWI